MKAQRLLADNISELLRRSHQTQKDLSQWCHHSEVWISKFLRGEREIQLKDLDLVADFFGLTAYQLFLPGIAPVSERRNSSDRRTGRERRIGRQVAMAEALGRELRQLGRRPQSDETARLSPLAEEVARVSKDFERRIAGLLSQAESRGQTATARRPRAKAPRGHRAPRGSDAPAD